MKLIEMSQADRINSVYSFVRFEIASEVLRVAYEAPTHSWDTLNTLKAMRHAITNERSTYWYAMYLRHTAYAAHLFHLRHAHT